MWLKHSRKPVNKNSNTLERTGKSSGVIYDGLIFLLKSTSKYNTILKCNIHSRVLFAQNWTCLIDLIALRKVSAECTTQTHQSCKNHRFPFRYHQIWGLLLSYFEDQQTKLCLWRLKILPGAVLDTQTLYEIYLTGLKNTSVYHEYTGWNSGC